MGLGFAARRGLVDAALGATALDLSIFTGLALTLLALAARRCAAVPALAALAAAPLVTLFEPGTSLDLAVLAAVLSSAVAVVVAEHAFAERSGMSLLAWIGLAMVVQWMLHAGLLLSSPFGGTTLIWLGVAPVLAGSLLAGIARFDPELAWICGLAAFAAGPGWNLATCGALAVALLVEAGWAVRARRRRWIVILVAPLAALLPGQVGLVVGLAAASIGALSRGTAVREPSRLVLGTVALVTLVVGAPPWHRAAPVASLAAGLAGRPFEVVWDLPVDPPPRLSVQSPVYEKRLADVSTRGLIVESFTTDSASLPCGTRVADLALVDHGVNRVVGSLAIGQGTGDWASGRPDVAARIGCPVLSPHRLWIPPGERHFGRTFRAAFDLSTPHRAKRLRIIRNPSLPAGVTVVLTRVGFEQ